MTSKKYIELLEGDEKVLLYHTQQYNKPNKYTKLLVYLTKKWRLIKPKNKILDLGCREE